MTSDAPTPPERDALIASARSLADALDHGDMDETDAALDPASEWISDAVQMLRADGDEIAMLKLRLGNLTEIACRAVCKWCQALEPVYYTKHMNSGLESWFHKSGACQASAARFALTPGAPDAR